MGRVKVEAGRKPDSVNGNLLHVTLFQGFQNRDYSWQSTWECK